MFVFFLSWQNHFTISASELAFCKRSDQVYAN
jgi:hypothetical protein